MAKHSPTNEGEEWRLSDTVFSRKHVGEVDADQYEDQGGACQVQHRRGDEVESIGGGEGVNSIALHREAGEAQVEEDPGEEGGRRE